MVRTGSLKINVFSTRRSSVKKEMNKNLQLGDFRIIQVCTRSRGVSAEYERVWHSHKFKLLKMAPEKKFEVSGRSESRTDKLKETLGKQRPGCEVL